MGLRTKRLITARYVDLSTLFGYDAGRREVDRFTDVNRLSAYAENLAPR